MTSRPHELTLGHEHEFEAAHGLPEALPAGERILWQGSPDAWRLAVQRFHVRKLAWYFAALLLLRGLLLAGDGEPAAAVARSLLQLGSLALLALALLGGIAWLSARSAVYTLTDRRLVLRVGIVLTLSFNLPFRALAGAALHRARDGSGDIALQLGRGEKIAWFHLWPHARPWRLAQPEPQLCCLRDAAVVAALLREAWTASAGVPQASAADAPATAAGAAAPAGAPAAAAPAGALPGRRAVRIPPRAQAPGSGVPA